MSAISFLYRLSRIIVAGLLLCWGGAARALDPHKPLAQFSLALWQTENGLPQNTVHAIAQTRDGYLWAATEEGLARFDGLRFTVFDKQNTPQFKSNYVRTLCADRRGALWIGTNAGLLKLADGQFTAYDTRAGLGDEHIDLIYEDHAGQIWVATDTSLSRFDNGAFNAFAPDAAQHTRGVQSLFEDQDGALWLGTNEGASRFKDGQFNDYTAQTGLPAGGVGAIAQSADGQLWFATPAGLACLHQGTFTIYTTRDGLPSNRINALYADSVGSLWTATAAGLSRFVDGRFDTYGAGEGLASAIVLALCEDAEGNLWVGTESGGLSLLKDKKFTTYTTHDGLPGDLVKAIYEDHAGGIWIGTYGHGLSLLKDGRFTNYTAADGLSSDIVLALAEDAQGNLWVGTPDGLDRYHQGHFTAYTSADGLANDFVRSIYEDKRGALWIGTRGGLTRMKAGTFTVYTTQDGLPNDFVGAIQEDAQGNLWVGTLGGLSRFHEGRFTTYTTRDGLSSDVVISLYEDGAGALWIGTNGGGLDRFKDGRFTTYTTQAGLFADVVYRVLEDGQGNLWLSSNKGIGRISKQELNDFAAGQTRAVTSVVYGTADGMATRECSGGGHPAGWRGRDGRLWFPTLKGVAMIDPARIKLNTQPPPVVIEQVSVDDEPLAFARAIELSPGKSRFDFYYTAPSFIAPEQVRFKYKLAGFDHDWVDGGARRVAYYTNLPPGHYKFTVLAANNDGIWNETGAAFEFYLKPRFYQTYWFYLLCLVALALAAWQLYRLRVRRMRGRFAAVLAERNRIARELHDNLAQEILGISVQLELVARLMPTSTETAKTHLDRARILVRNSINEARRYVWDLRAQALEQHDLPTALSDTARRLTAETAVQAQVQVSGAFRPLPAATENNLLRIGQEAVNNAVRHAEATRILINLSFASERVQLSVRDDGRGFDYAAQTQNGGAHFGLLGMRERAEQLGGTLNIHSTPDGGTEVVVDVPLTG
jgi:ligand-binding sensor domain-containing protein/signal transduction histidine kinase